MPQKYHKIQDGRKWEAGLLNEVLAGDIPYGIQNTDGSFGGRGIGLKYEFIDCIGTFSIICKEII
jgi:hypothetical protein